MTLIWKKNYSMGVPELDEQHRQIFELVNELGELIQRKIYDSPEVEGLIEALKPGLQEHFTMEEGCMSRHACPMAKKNKDEHDQAMRIYVDFCAEFSTDKSLAGLTAFHKAIEGWLLEHICYVDIHMRACVG